MTGKGVEIPSIKAIDNAVTKYEREKDARCKLSPKEVAAKADLQEQLHKHRDKLPRNEDGFAFYRIDGVDYVLEEKMSRRKVVSGGGGDDE